MYYIGLMSGTSMDGIDAALVAFGDPGVDIVATHQHPYAETLRHALRKAALTPVDEPIGNLGALDRQVGEHFLAAANALLDKAGVDKDAVAAVGSHGQTVRHQPDGPRPYTLQIGNPDTIAAGTGITTVADFRSADMAVGGQGAPLVPPFHEWLFGRGQHGRVIANIGGIANLTILPAGDAPVTGFDTGPGNTLLDLWIRSHRNEAFDRNGDWAAGGTVEIWGHWSRFLRRTVPEVLMVLCGTLLLALFYARQVNNADPGNARMRELMDAIRAGAMAFIRREYIAVAAFVVVLATLILIFLDYGRPWGAIAYVFGACLSALAGFVGMRIATAANARTTEAARTGGIKAALPPSPLNVAVRVRGPGSRNGMAKMLIFAGIVLIAVGVAWLLLWVTARPTRRPDPRGHGAELLGLQPRDPQERAARVRRGAPPPHPQGQAHARRARHRDG